jgi:hypothetical protein
VGRYGENTAKNNGQLLIDFCDQQNLELWMGNIPHKDTYFHKSKMQGTWDL